MAFTKNNVIIDHDLKRLGGTDLYNYVAHVLCLKGSFSFGYNVNHFTLHGGEAMIIGTQRLFEGGDASADLEAICIYVSPEFLRICTPKNNYDISKRLGITVFQPRLKVCTFARTNSYEYGKQRQVQESP